MAKKSRSQEVNDEVNLDESSIYGKDADGLDATGGDDVATEATLDRLENITGGADDPVLYQGRLGRKVDALNAGTDEELDALQVNLLQDDAVSSTGDGSGRVIDDVAEQTIARFTETGPGQPDLGAEPVVPGRDNTSSAIRRRHPDTDRGRSESLLEGNLDEPRDEAVSERTVDERTGG